MRRLLVLLLLAGCAAPPSPLQRQRDVVSLSEAFPVLQQLRVEDYRNQDWCQNLSYRRGQFSRNNEATTCNLFQGKAIAFTPKAQKDFDAIAQALQKTGVRLLYLNVQYNPQGTIVAAEFNLENCSCAYVYQPNYTALPENLPNEVEHTAIDRNWYLVQRDWN